jgi:hypothetical protein
MNKNSGTAGSAVSPTAPKAAEEADVADPGEVTAIKAEQRQTQSGKYGAVQTKPFQPPPEPNSESEQSTRQESTEEPPKKSWIEIELVGENGEAIAGERYRITLPDNRVAEGTLDSRGFARVDGFDPGTCKVTFPELDQEAWEKI